MATPSPNGPRRLRRAAAAIFVAGALAAAVLFAIGQSSADAGSGNYQIVGGQSFAVEESASQRAQTERMGGHALLMTADFDRWFSSLWHAPRLPWTVLVLAASAALVCVYIAGLMAEELHDHDDDHGG